ncbi:MAG: hypothetical protein JXA54_16350 [Candidatus Heimdallarchaeota archaeon]|nr:hypothetical protein [Candidatus Heimdallarchaeota archaeon]
MFKDIKYLKKNVDSLTKAELFTNIKNIRNSFDMKYETKYTEEFAEVLFTILEYFSGKIDYNSERIILNQLFEISWWADENSLTIDYLTKAISLVLIDSRSTRGKDRTELFSDFVNIIARFPNNKKVYSAISTAAIELIKWGKDKEILEILEIIQSKAAIYPLVEVIQLLNAKTFMNTLFYLVDQDCNTIKHIYNQFSSFAISNFEDEFEVIDHKFKNIILDEEVNEILQEGAINAIINLARINKRLENTCNECLLGIRRIIQDSEYLLRKKGQDFYRDINRLSYVLDQYKLWNEFIDIKLVADLKEELEKNQTYEQAQGKLLAIIKNMRIEEYDSLKIGRRGLRLAYDLNDLDDINNIVKELLNQNTHSLKSINLVEEIDAIVDYDTKLKEHLRETGQIPSDRNTVDELLDQTTISDDLTLSVTKEEKIVEQVKFLKELELKDFKHIENQILLTQALIFAVAMHGFNSPILNISPNELINEISALLDRKIVMELVDPLIRAVTLRAARLDGKAVSILLDLLNKKGLKFLDRYYKQYNFIDNLIRLISYLGRTGQTELLKQIKNGLQIANRLIIKDDEIPMKIARAINEGILAFSCKDITKKIELINLNKELAKINSYNIDLQLKYVEGMNFLLLDLNHLDSKTIFYHVNEIIDFSKIYRQNQKIKEKAAIGILWSIAIMKIFNQRNKIDEYKKELNNFIASFPDSEYLKEIQTIANKTIGN